MRVVGMLFVQLYSAVESYADALLQYEKCQPDHLPLSLQIGYYFSAFTVDKPWMGRVRLQSMVSRQGVPTLSSAACLTVLMCCHNCVGYSC